MSSNALLEPVEMERSGRRYGLPSQAVHTRAEQGIPAEVGLAFVHDLKADSAIMALSPDATHEQIFTAYGTDIKVLEQRRKEADGFMLDLLICAMERSKLDTASRDKEKGMFQELLMPLGITPQIPFTATRAAMEAGELVVWLKQAFNDEIVNIARRIATSLHFLADHNIVGLIDWKGLEICQFHYFTWNIVSQADVKTDRTGNLMAWNTLTTTVTETSKLVRNRYTHHVVSAALHMIGDYKRPLPTRITDLVGKAPKWLLPHLVVVDGTEILCQTVTDVAGQKTTMTSQSVTRYDPAIALGPFVLAGWNDEDLPPPSTTGDGTPSTTAGASEGLGFGSILGIALLVVIVVVSAVALIGSFSVDKAIKAHAAYHLAHLNGKRERFITTMPEAIKLPAGDLLSYRGFAGRPGAIHLARTINYNGGSKEEWTTLLLPEASQGVLYGDLYLQQALGLPFVLHVTSATRDRIEYTVEALPQPRTFHSPSK